ncbi:MAG: ABC transporter permease [Ruminococcus sp.]|uniref:ABC transporter permease n=1 Tax=Ruminococcus sp. TaxID=41978 RepID=UPI0025F1822F|nr:ABC transporter permease [Ruminococcus sp.]MCR5599195.1 ABC transporter permease [Ruminococcus sp.]
MYDENPIAGGLPEEIDYTADNTKKEGPTGVTAPVLDDFGYTAPTAKKDGPTGVSAPVLDEIDSFAQNTGKKGAPTGVSAPVLDDDIPYYDNSKKGAPTGISAPVLDDDVPYQSSSAPKGAPTGVSAPVLDDTITAVQDKKVLSDEDIINGLTPELKARFEALPADKQQQIIDMRRTQLGAVAPPVQVKAPVLDEDNYTPPPKPEAPAPQPSEPISAPILDDEPEPPKYQPKYVDEDLERAKAEAAKKAVSSQLVSEQKDSKESLRMMLQLKEEARQREAAKGFKLTIVIAIIGVISAVAFYLLYSGQLGLSYKNGLEGFNRIIESSALYISAIVGVLSLSLLTGIKGLKSLTSFAMLLFGVIQIFPGLGMLPQHNGSTALKAVLFLVSLAGTVASFFILSGSEAVGQYFNNNSSD